MNEKIFTVLIATLLLMETGNAWAIHPPDQTPDSNTVVFHADPRIGLILTTPPTPYTGRARGFRVQIYSGMDRQKANQIKVRFLRNHPGVRAYLTYTKPHFRVRVGDFRSRSEASVLYDELSRRFSCMIVPAIIYLPPPGDRD